MKNVSNKYSRENIKISFFHLLKFFHVFFFTTVVIVSFFIFMIYSLGDTSFESKETIIAIISLFSIGYFIALVFIIVMSIFDNLIFKNNFEKYFIPTLSFVDLIKKTKTKPERRKIQNKYYMYNFFRIPLYAVISILIFVLVLYIYSFSNYH